MSVIPFVILVYVVVKSYHELQTFKSAFLFWTGVISKIFLGSTIRYKVGTNKTKNSILIVDKSSNDSEVFNLDDYVKIDFLQQWKIEL